MKTMQPCKWCGERPENTGAVPDDMLWFHECLDGFVALDIEEIIEEDKEDDDQF